MVTRPTAGFTLSPMPSKQEFPPIWPGGFYPMTLPEIWVRCVNDFPLSTTRRGIMTGFEAVLTRLSNAGIPATVWLDGSFLTRKIDPEDVDIVSFVAADILNALTREQDEILDWYLDKSLWHTHHCDAYLAPDYSEGHPLHSETVRLFDYWQGWFGRSRAKEPKGIVTVTVVDCTGGAS